jgi:hypothetical protein
MCGSMFSVPPTPPPRRATVAELDTDGPGPTVHGAGSRRRHSSTRPPQPRQPPPDRVAAVAFRPGILQRGSARRDLGSARCRQGDWSWHPDPPRSAQWWPLDRLRAWSPTTRLDGWRRSLRSSRTTISSSLRRSTVVGRTSRTDSFNELVCYPAAASRCVPSPRPRPLHRRASSTSSSITASLASAYLARLSGCASAAFRFAAS